MKALWAGMSWAGMAIHCPRQAHAERLCRKSNLAEADLGHHALEAGAHDAAGGRTAEIVVDDLDLMPAQVLQPLPHGILERPALAVVQDLVGRGLPHVKDGFAILVVRPDIIRGPRRPAERLRRRRMGVFLRFWSQLSLAAPENGACDDGWPPGSPPTKRQQRRQIHTGSGCQLHGQAGQPVAHPGRQFLPAVRARATSAADHVPGRLLDHLMNTDDTSSPRVPGIKDLSFLSRFGPVGVPSPGCTTSSNLRRASTGSPPSPLPTGPQ